MIPRNRAPRPEPVAKVAESAPLELVRYRDFDFILTDGTSHLTFSLTDADSADETPDMFSLRIGNEVWCISKRNIAAYRYAERVIERPAKLYDPGVH